MAAQTDELMLSDFEGKGSVSNGERPSLTTKKSVLYIDQYWLSRDCIARRLSDYLPDFHIETIANAEDLWVQDAKTIRFALTILHAHMAHPGEDKIAGQLMLMSHRLPYSPIVLLTDIGEDSAIAEALHLGVYGYITTRQSMRDTAESIRAVAAGTTVVPSGALNLTRASSVATSVPSQAASTDSHVKFTRRQLDILALLWKGKSNKLIAHELNMSQSTVKVHIRLIMQKLHATNRTQVVLLSRPVVAHRDQPETLAPICRWNSADTALSLP